jgi:dienelactone hydrolase
MKNNIFLEPQLRLFYTTQVGNPDPAPFKGLDWQRELTQFRQAWNAFIGPVPNKKCVPLNPQEEPLDLSSTELARVTTSSYQMKKVSYRGAHGQRIPAFLLIPNSIRVGDKVPAILVMHQALPICGKKEAAGVCDQGTAWLNFAQDFAEKGFVTLAPDSIGYGERSQYYADTGLEYSDAAPLISQFPSSTLMGIRISDVMRGVDYLETLPFVDKNKIGMIGHSNGGIETLLNAVYDPRIKCAVSNAGPNMLRREVDGWWGLSPGIARWAGGGYIPAMGFFNHEVKNLPIEIHQLYALVAPRGLFVNLIEDDTVAPKNDRIQFAMDQTKRVYDALGGDFAYHIVRSGLTPENRREWGAPGCMVDNYDACQKSADPMCKANFLLKGVTATCIADNGSVEGCAHELWMNCLKTNTEAVCEGQFVSVGVTDSCVEAAFQKYSRRDHGWYPETEAEAYPWMERCLKR